VSRALFSLTQRSGSEVQKSDVSTAKNHAGGSRDTRSGRDSLDENPALGRADLDVEVEQEVHPEHAIDTVSKLGHVDMHGGCGDTEVDSSMSCTK
jgi:hypothetical protein